MSDELDPRVEIQVSGEGLEKGFVSKLCKKKLKVVPNCQLFLFCK